MRNLIAQFLILALLSSNSYAGPFVDRNRPDIRPDIRPGQRGSIAQDAIGASHNQYSLLNPGSNQSVFVRNILLQQYGNNSNTEGYMIFNPQSSLPSNGAIVSLDAMAKHLLETNGDNSLANRVASTPFASKVAKSQTQGMAFVRTGNSFANNKNASSATFYPAGTATTIADLAIGSPQPANGATGGAGGNGGLLVGNGATPSPQMNSGAPSSNVTKPSVSSKNISPDSASGVTKIVNANGNNDININYPGQSFGFAPSDTTKANPNSTTPPNSITMPAAPTYNGVLPSPANDAKAPTSVGAADVAIPMPPPELTPGSTESSGSVSAPDPGTGVVTSSSTAP